MNWIKLTSEDELNQIKTLSEQGKVLIFKHSTRCSISSMALSRLERAWKDDEMKGVKPYFLDLIAYRNLSNRIAEEFGVQHESPQVLMIEKGKCIYHDSHSGISYQEIKNKAS